jgi:hypothetical protein
LLDSSSGGVEKHTLESIKAVSAASKGGGKRRGELCGGWMVGENAGGVGEATGGVSDRCRGHQKCALNTTIGRQAVLSPTGRKLARECEENIRK